MRQTLTTLIVLLICLIGCQQPEFANDTALHTTRPSGIIPLGGHAHQFPSDSSVILISNLASAQQLSQLGGDFGWGGSFPASAFRVSAANQGVLLWYCFRSGSTPELFLALEHLESYDPRNLPSQPISDELLLPTTIFHASTQSFSTERAIRDQLRSTAGEQPRWVTLASSEVSRYVISADSLFAGYRDASGERYNNYMFGFFSARHEAAFNDFVESAGENGYIRYYFGYDERDKPNRIRIILMAVTANGYNRSMARTSDDDGGGSMQRSWPPPPEN